MHEFIHGSKANDGPQRQLTRVTRLSFLDGFFYSCMVGCGETYIVAFALALGFSPGTAGLTSILPLVAGALLQPLLSRTLLRHMRARVWSVTCCILQALALASLGAAGYFLRFTPALLVPVFFALASWYWTVSLAITPVWNIWIGQLIPAEKHLDFFVKRTRILQGAMLIGIIGAGFYLHRMENSGGNIALFALLLGLAGMFRLLSAWCLWRHPDAPLGQLASPKVGSAVRLGWLSEYPAAMMLTFSFLTNLAVYFSSPFFIPFMLRDLKVDYSIYAVLTSLSFIARVLTANVMAAVGGRFGVKMLLIMGSTGIVPVAWMWTVSHTLAYLVFVQFVTGFVWGCHELGVTLYLMETVADAKRIKLLSLMQMTTAFGMLAGSMLGTLFVVGRPLNTTTYHQIFTLSSLLRALPALVLLLWTPKIIAALRSASGQIGVLFTERAIRLKATGVRPVRHGRHSVSFPHSPVALDAARQAANLMLTEDDITTTVQPHSLTTSQPQGTHATRLPLAK